MQPMLAPTRTASTSNEIITPKKTDGKIKSLGTWSLFVSFHSLYKSRVKANLGKKDSGMIQGEKGCCVSATLSLGAQAAQGRGDAQIRF
jgi:hypothetical protein